MTSVSVSSTTHPLVSICNALICLGAMACLITGIVFLTSDNSDSTAEADDKVFVGTILTAIGGTIIGIQVLCVVAICCTFAVAGWCVGCSEA